MSEHPPAATRPAAEARASRRVRVALLLAALILLAAMTQAWLRLDLQAPAADDRHFVAMAWNLAEHGIPSLVLPDPAAAAEAAEPPPPSMFREPGYPILLATLMRLVPAARQAAFCDQPAAAQACATALHLAQGLNVALILAAACLTAWAVLSITGSTTAALLALAILALSPKVIVYAEFLISESLALFLAAAAATLLLPAARRGNAALWAALAAGLACGALGATKQAFLPLLLPAAMALALATCRLSPARLGPGAGLLRAGLLCLGWIAVVGPWLFWNLSTFGTPFPSDRAREGEVLAYRVELLEMTRAEYGIAWLWWTSNFGDDIARDHFPEAVWSRFQDHRPDAFTPASHRRWAGDVAAAQAGGMLPPQAWAAVATDYRDRLLAAWPRHMAISLPVLNRGLWVDNFAIVTVPCLLVLLLFAWRWRLAAFYLFAVPGLAGLALHAGLTNNIPRWNLPLAPVLAAAAAVLIWQVWGRIAPILRPALLLPLSTLVPGRRPEGPR